MTTTLPLFWHLSSGSKTERVDASVKLIEALEKFQSQFGFEDSADTSDNDREQDERNKDVLDAMNAPDVSYSIRRLIRGLASPRESSRLGFAVALTEVRLLRAPHNVTPDIREQLLSRINTVTCSQVVALILDSSKRQGSMTGQEERDILFARLFGLTAVIQSALLVRVTPLPSSASSTTQASSFSSYQDVLSQLMAAAEKKSWLRESAWWAIMLGVDKLQNSNVPWKETAIDDTIQNIFVGDKTWSPEKIAMALKLQGMCPDKDWQKLMAPPFKDPDPLSTGNLAVLARILKVLLFPIHPAQCSADVVTVI